MAITFEIPGEAPSVSNLREHWAKRAERAKSQKAATLYRGKRWLRDLPPLLVITLTRNSPRKLDDDNLRGALKSYRDGVATALRIDDASPLVSWRYEQAKAEHSSVQVRVWAPLSEPMQGVEPSGVLGVGK